MKILVIIPAYNEEENLKGLLQHLERVSLPIDFLVVNDASQDATSEIARQTGVRVLDLPINLGIGGAVQTGYQYARDHQYDLAVQVDGDGQHNPDFLPLLVKPLERGEADLVIGSRFLESGGFRSSWSRRLGIGLIRGLIKLTTGKTVTDPTSGFRACNRRLIEEFARYYPVDYPEPESLVGIFRENYRILEIPVVMKERSRGLSSINGFGPLYYMLKVCLAIVIERFKKIKHR